MQKKRSLCRYVIGIFLIMSFTVSGSAEGSGDGLYGVPGAENPAEVSASAWLNGKDAGRSPSSSGHDKDQGNVSKPIEVSDRTTSFKNDRFITADTIPFLLQAFLPESLESAGLVEPGEVIRCLTPYLIIYQEQRDLLEPRIVKLADRILFKDITGAETYLSSSGRFRLVFQREGHHSVPPEDASGTGIPDYVEKAADYADYSWIRQVKEYGFEDPVVSGPLTIEFRNIGARTYGYTLREGSTTRIVVHHNFENFPENTDPDGNQLGALKATIAHELKHSIQFVTNQWQGDAGSIDWIEMDATMMENIVFPQVNDYYHYIGGTAGIFGNPRRSTPVAYSHVTWSLFFAEYLGVEYWVDTWREISQEPLVPVVTAMRRAFPGRSPDPDDHFTRLLARNHLWHATAGSRSVDGYGFSESEAYPDARMENTAKPLPEIYRISDRIEPLSAAYRMLHFEARQTGSIYLSADSDAGRLGLGLLGYHGNGLVQEWIFNGDDAGLGEVDSPFNAAELDSLLLVIVNGHRFETLTCVVQFRVYQIPEQVTLEPNYPNPFTSSQASSTTLAFSLPERGSAVITVYDLTGRRVARIFDQMVEPGRHTVLFDASGLAAGVYIYRLTTDTTQKSGKMVWIP